MKIQIIILLIIIGWISTISGFERHKFNTCEQKAYCNRLRVKHSRYQAEDIKLKPMAFDGEKEGDAIVGRLKDETNAFHDPLTIIIKPYTNGMWRMRIKEEEEKSVKGNLKNYRKAPEDVLVVEALTSSIKLEKINEDQYKAIHPEGSYLIIYTGKGEESMKVNFYDARHVLLNTFNADAQLIMESIYREKEEGYEGDGAIGFDMKMEATHVYGIPSRAMALSLRSTRNQEKVLDEPYRMFNLDVFRYELDTTLGLYAAVPFMYGIRKGVGASGFFVLNPSDTWIDVDKQDDHVNVRWVNAAGSIDIFMIPGPTPMDVIKNYVSLTGKPLMPQRFSLAYHQCRWNYKDRQDVENVDSKFDEHNIPYDVLWLDIEHTDDKKYFTWDSSLFPEPKTMIEALAAKGRKMVTIVDPHIKRVNGYYVHDEATKNNYYVKTKDGKDYDGHCWPGSSSWVDYFNPKARDWWAGLFRHNRYEGSTPSLYTWNDMNEPAVFSGDELTMPPDNVHYGERTHREVHNQYGFYQGMATYQGHLWRSENKDRPFILTRSFFAGSQRFVHAWSGDNTASWDHLDTTAGMLLSISQAGFPFIGSDVGGFFDNPEEDLLVRWYQTGAFYPFFRAHAEIQTKRREPWLFSENTLSLIREAVIRRYVILPYYYTVSVQAARDGSPVMRSTFLEYPQDEHTYDMESQFFVGSDLLIAPVTQKDATIKKVYYPGKGSWYCFESGKRISRTGPSSRDVPVTLASVPIYQRGGSIIPTRRRVRRSSTQMDSDPLTLNVALSHKLDAHGELYLDDGSSFEYRTHNRFLRLSFSLLPSTPLSDDSFVLSSSIMDENSSFEPAESLHIESIVIAGYPRKPSSVVSKVSMKSQSEFSSVGLDGVQSSLDFSYNADDLILTIHRPSLPLSTPFSISLINE
mmetsp:Transcript_1756/g.2602  ORF Transcript_1756/g.2602 Transcript_1756/m.2602 type:complete len:913 (+) Transcript_1756:17-2755(+)